MLSFALIVKDAIASVRVRSPYYIGDWLINYRGGFIRRGLPGELVFWAAKATHIPSVWIIFAATMFLYLLFQICVFRMVQELRWSYILVALMLSPAALPFEFLNPAVGVRKEILLFLTLSWVMSSPRIRSMNTRAVSALLTMACVVMVLSHESLIIFLPYILAGLIIRFNEVKKAFQVTIAPALGAAIAAIAVILHPGNAQIANTVCDSIGGHLEAFGIYDGTPCSGAISWLRESFSDAHLVTWQYVSAFNYFRVFTVLAILAFAPALLLLYRVYTRSTNRLAFCAIAGSAVVSLVGTSILFYGAIDWGRWIHFHALCLMLLLIPLFAQHGAHETKPVALPLGRKVLAAAMVLIYATSWTLPITRTNNRSIFGGVWQRMGEKVTGHTGSAASTNHPNKDAISVPGQGRVSS